MKARCVVGITGGSGAGKSYFANKLKTRLGKDRVVVLSQDFYYIGKSEDDIINMREINFDHPDAFDINWFSSNIDDLVQGETTRRPVYSMKLQRRLGRTLRIEPVEVIIIEGTLIFIPEKIRTACDVRIYLDVPQKIRHDRRIARDLKVRERRIFDIMEQLRKFVVPMHEEFVEPQKKWAHEILNGTHIDEAVFKKTVAGIQAFL